MRKYSKLDMLGVYSTVYGHKEAYVHIATVTTGHTLVTNSIVFVYQVEFELNEHL